MTRRCSIARGAGFGILQKENRGLLLEDKGIALAMHFRLAPKLAPEVEMVMNEMSAELGEAFIVRPGKCVFELMPRGFDERSAIQLLMKEREFAGRTPVFVGDDPTDEVGFQAVNEMGGHSIRVGNLEDNRGSIPIQQRVHRGRLAQGSQFEPLTTSR